MTVGLYWHSRTGTTRRAVEMLRGILEDRGAEVRAGEIRPRWDLPYPLWLALSFVPGSRFPVRPGGTGPTEVSRAVVAFPKWTFSHPPVNAFLARVSKTLPPTGLLVTCGGWDQERYLEGYRRRLERLGVEVRSTLAIKKKHLGAPATREALARFADALLAGPAA
ncbi:hypothetical protein [Deferrisoma sp.]